MNVKKTFRPKSGHEGCEITFPNPLTGETVNISEWPFTTESSVEMAHLDGHPWITDRPEPKNDGAAGKTLTKMTKDELLSEAEHLRVEVDSSMKKAEIVAAIKDAEKPPPTPEDEASDDTGGNE